MASILPLDTITHDAAGWLYFIQQGENGPIKIGHATDPLHRLRNLQGGNPEPLRIVAATRGAADLEKPLHRHFKRFRIGRTEWFLPEPVLEYLRQAGANDPDAF